MKKIVLSIILSFFCFSAVVLSADYFTMGKEAFNRKDYENANIYFVKALTANPNDPTARYYYAQTLTYLKNYKQARKEYGYVMMLAPNTKLSDYSNQSVKYLDEVSTPDNVKKDLSSDNYIKNAVSNTGELLTWDTNKMPIKVYIDNSKRVSYTYVNSVKDALTTWQSATTNIVQFMLVSDPTYADVTIIMSGIAEKSGNQTLGLTEHQSKDGYLNKATLTIYTLGQNYKPLMNYDVYNVTLHELGHLLGVDGHSDDANDVMHSTYSPANHSARMTLSQRDINTVKALYEIDKNPYATGLNSINRVLGSKEERLNDKLQSSLDYIKKVPENSIGYVNAGNVYLSMGNEIEAINNYQKALVVSPNDYTANNKLASIYTKRNDLKNAEVYYRNMIKIQPKDTNAYVGLMNLYIQNNKPGNAKVLLNNLFYRNPAAKKDPQVQKIMTTLTK